MKPVRKTIDFTAPAIPATGRVDSAREDATTEVDIARLVASDEAEAMRDAAQFARRVRKRLGLSQAAFSQRIDAPLETIRDEQRGKRCTTGAGKALLKV